VPDPSEFRREFPVLERVSYLNAGTTGPAPRRGVEAAAEWLRRDLHDGRSSERRWEEIGEMSARLRERLAAWLGCEARNVALTRSTTDGVNVAVNVMDLGPGDEVVTSDEEHPGVAAPLAAGAKRRGFTVRQAPFGELAGAVTDETSLIACSHVSWVSGQLAAVDDLAATGKPLLLDGAQGLGAIELAVPALGCDFYAASGQKWLCGPEGSGSLYVSGRMLDREPAWPGYESLADSTRAAEGAWHPDARRFETNYSTGFMLAWSLGALDVLDDAGKGWVVERATGLAAWFADLLRDSGVEVVPRAETTLVTWRAEDPVAQVAALAEQSIVIRSLPGRPYARASVGAWTSEDELELLCRAVSRG
jgi:L-cysteine/cystine lyase